MYRNTIYKKYLNSNSNLNHIYKLLVSKFQMCKLEVNKLQVHKFTKIEKIKLEKFMYRNIIYIKYLNSNSNLKWICKLLTYKLWVYKLIFEFKFKFEMGM